MTLVSSALYYILVRSVICKSNEQVLESFGGWVKAAIRKFREPPLSIPTLVADHKLPRIGRSLATIVSQPNQAYRLFDNATHPCHYVDLAFPTCFGTFGGPGRYRLRRCQRSPRWGRSPRK